MAIPLGGETVGKDPGEILRRNAHPVVLHHQPNEAGHRYNADNHPLFSMGRAFAGLLRIAQQVDQYLQYFVFFGLDGGNLLKFATHLNIVAHHHGRMNLERLLDNVADIQGLNHGGTPGEILLNGHNLFDVLNIVLQLAQFLQDGGLFGRHMLGQLGQIRRNLTPARIHGQKITEVLLVLLEQPEPLAKLAITVVPDPLVQTEHLGKLVLQDKPELQDSQGQTVLQAKLATQQNLRTKVLVLPNSQTDYVRTSLKLIGKVGKWRISFFGSS